MRKIVLSLVLVALLSPILPAQSVTISQDKLDELTAILKDYVTITQKLQVSLDSSQQQINVLQLGLTQYEGTVNGVLIPKAEALESQVFWLKVGIGVNLGIDAAALIYLGGHAVHLW